MSVGSKWLFLMAIGSQLIMVWLMGRTGKVEALLPWIVIVLVFIISPWGSHYAKRLQGGETTLDAGLHWSD